MITRIELTNFMSHQHTVLEPAAGLTVLVGPNNCGKSAIVAALQILCTNENSTYVMRHGARECSVRVETDDGHTIEWRRKTAPSYVIDGKTFDRLRGSGLPDELHAALRMPMVEAGDNTDFDIHFGTQKSPIFLLGGSAANAARFFASSSDAIRLVEMQKRHKEKLANAQREKVRLEAESKQVNAALGILEPVVDLEKRLAAARGVYNEVQRLAGWIAAAERGEAALRAQAAIVRKHASQVGALRALSQPPEMVPAGPLQELIEAILAAWARLQDASSLAKVLRSLPTPPSLAPTEPLRALVEAIQSERKRRETVALQSRVLSALPPPPDLPDVSPLDSLIANIARVTRYHQRAAGESKTLSQISTPPQLADIGPLHRLVERLTEAAGELAARRGATTLLGGLREPPKLADVERLAASVNAMESARRRVVNWERISATFAAIASAPAVADPSPMSELVRRMEETGKRVRTCEAAQQAAACDLTEAAAKLRQKVDGKVCPICGSLLDAGKVIARATLGLEGHEHG
jgi:exonuclease SbcC